MFRQPVSYSVCRLFGVSVVILSAITPEGQEERIKKKSGHFRMNPTIGLEERQPHIITHHRAVKGHPDPRVPIWSRTSAFVTHDQ